MVILQLTGEQLTDIVQGAVRQAIKDFKAETPAPEKDKLLSVDEAAAFLNLSTSTIYTKVSQNAIPYHKQRGGKRLYFYEQELTDWLKGGRKSPVEEQAKSYRKARRRA